MRLPAPVEGLRARWWTLSSSQRFRITLAAGVAVLVLYPRIDSLLKLQLMGAAVPIAVFVVLAVALPVLLAAPLMLLPALFMSSPAVWAKAVRPDARITVERTAANFFIRVSLRSL